MPAATAIVCDERAQAFRSHVQFLIQLTVPADLALRPRPAPQLPSVSTVYTTGLPRDIGAQPADITARVHREIVASSRWRRSRRNPSVRAGVPVTCDAIHIDTGGVASGF
jgi:hypothetical protein